MSDEKEMVLSFDGGHVEGMYFDDFPLDFLEGVIHIDRATDIRFNETTQDWEIVLIGQDAPVSDAVKGFKKYEEARKFEVLWLQTCRKLEIDPDAQEGIYVAIALREKDRFDSKYPDIVAWNKLQELRTDRAIDMDVLAGAMAKAMDREMMKGEVS